MSAFAWSVKAPVGFGRLHGFSIPGVPIPSGSVSTSATTTVQTAQINTATAVPSVPVVQSTVKDPSYLVAAIAPTLAPRIEPAAGPSDVARQVDRMAESAYAETLTPSAPSPGSSPQDPILPGEPPLGVDVGPTPGSTGTARIPWLWLGLGAVGGLLIGALLAR